MKVIFLLIGFSCGSSRSPLFWELSSFSSTHRRFMTSLSLSLILSFLKCNAVNKLENLGHQRKTRKCRTINQSDGLSIALVYSQTELHCARKAQLINLNPSLSGAIFLASPKLKQMEEGLMNSHCNTAIKTQESYLRRQQLHVVKWIFVV